VRLAIAVVAAVAEQDGQAVLRRGRLDARGQVGEEGVADVQDDQTDGSASCATRPSSAIALSTRSRVAGATRSGRLSTLDTVPSDTPARAATSMTLADSLTPDSPPEP